MMERAIVNAVFLFFCALAPGVVASQGPADNAKSFGTYERYVKAPRLNGLEKRLLKSTRRWFRAQKRPLRYDARLAQVARRLLDQVPDGRDEAFDLRTAEQKARYWGLTDGLVVAIAFQGSARPHKYLRNELSTHLSGTGVNRVGLAARREDSKTTCLVIFSRRLVRLLPMPSRIWKSKDFLISGKTNPGLQPKNLELVVSVQGGETSRHALALAGNHFTGRLDVPAGLSGRILEIQLLLDRGRGPEIAAEFPIGVGRSPINDAGEAFDPVSQATLSLANKNIVEQVWGVRSSQGLNLPAESSALRAIAKEHAREMATKGFFAHVSPSSGNVLDRLKRAGISFVQAYENIAVGENIREIMPLWLDSPSHRSNLLAPQVDAIGAAVHSVRGPTTKHYAVLVLARLGEGGDEESLRGRAIHIIQKKRRELGFGTLIVDADMQALAQRHAREMGFSGELRAESYLHGPLVETAFRELEIEEAGVDVYRAETTDIVGSFAPDRALFTHLGVGIYRGDSQPGAGLWICVLYGSL